MLGSRSSVASTITTPTIATSRMTSIVQNPKLNRRWLKNDWSSVPAGLVTALAIIASPSSPGCDAAFSHMSAGVWSPFHSVLERARRR